MPGSDPKWNYQERNIELLLLTYYLLHFNLWCSIFVVLAVYAFSQNWRAFFVFVFEPRLSDRWNLVSSPEGDSSSLFRGSGFSPLGLKWIEQHLSLDWLSPPHPPPTRTPTRTLFLLPPPPPPNIRTKNGHSSVLLKVQNFVDVLFSQRRTAVFFFFFFLIYIYKCKY